MPVPAGQAASPGTTRLDGCHGPWQWPCRLGSGERHAPARRRGLVGGIYREAHASVPYPVYELTSSGVTHPWTTAVEAGPNRLGPLVTVQHYGLVDIDCAARTVTLALRDVNNHSVHQHGIAFDELGMA